MNDFFRAPYLVFDMPSNGMSTEVDLTVYGARGEPLAVVREVGVSALRKGWRFMHASRNEAAAHNLAVLRPDGMPLLSVVKPYKAISDAYDVRVLAANGQPIGRFREGAFRQLRYEIFDAWDRQLAVLNQYRVTDWQGVEVATCVLSRSNWGEALAGGVRQVLQFRYVLPEPLHTLVLCAPLAMATTIWAGVRGGVGLRAIDGLLDGGLGF